jgi:hypothetical protein
VKRLVTDTSRDGPPLAEVARQVVSAYIDAAGGARRFSRGAGSTGRGRSAQRVAAGLARFATDVAQAGLPAALERVGLPELVGRSVIEVLDALVDYLGGPADSLDDVDARNALARLRAEKLNHLATEADLERALMEMVTSDGLGDLLVSFFGYYLFEQFTRVFYERLVARVGDVAAAAYLRGIEAYIRKATLEHHFAQDLRNVDWASTEGQRLADAILEETLRVFGGG